MPVHSGLIHGTSGPEWRKSGQSFMSVCSGLKRVYKGVLSPVPESDPFALQQNNSALDFAKLKIHNLI